MGVLGRMRGRVRFERREEIDDGYGNVEGAWVAFATVAARLRFMRGGEQVLEQRIVGVQPVIITVRASTETRQVSTGDRAVNTRNGTPLDIKSVAPDEVGAFIEILCEAGR